MPKTIGLSLPGLTPEDLAAWSGGRWLGQPGLITGVSNDTRFIKRGDLFFALRGATQDGHAYLEDAFKAGAAGVVAEKGRCSQPGTACLEVDDPAAALQRMAAGYRNSLNPFMLGVTGSVGKTTVKEMIAEVLGMQAPVARTFGNWNNELGLPLSLLSMPAGTEIGVFEMGISHPGELAPLCSLLKPQWGVITRIGPVHLEFFESVAAIAREKSVLLQALPKDGLAVLNAADPCYSVLIENCKVRLVTVALDQAADYAASTSEQGGRLQIKERNGISYSLEVPLPGRHNAENALLALAVGREQGLAPDAIQTGLMRVRPPPMRWEISHFAGIKIVNDAYNANPLSMRAAIKAFAAEQVQGGRWLLLAGMRELGAMEKHEHESLGSDIANGNWAGLMTVGALASFIAGAALKAGMAADRVAVCSDHAAAAHEMAQRLRQGDAVLLKGSRGEHLETVLDFWRLAMGSGEIEQ